MAAIDSYRNEYARKNQELAKLMEDKAKEQKKLSDISIKSNRASEEMRRSKNQSTINSKLRDITKYQADSAKLLSNLATIESKIAKKNKELNETQKKIDREVLGIEKKQKQEGERTRRNQEQSFKSIIDTLSSHQTFHHQTFQELRSLREIPKKIVVLFLASNPIDQQHLRLDEEARAISEMIKKAKHRDSVQFETCWAVQPIDVLQAINEHDPTIVHFSGHGSDNDEIVFQTNDGQTKLVSKEAIVQTMMASSENLRLVFFNTCYSKNQAIAVAEHIEATIGMNTSIGDEAARIFSSQFYSSISFGQSVKKSFDQARALLMLESIDEENTPELFVNVGTNPDELILVSP